MQSPSFPHRAHGRVSWFLLVGCAAAAVHWSIVVLLVSHGAWRPLTANVIGWMIAFGVSFSGHHRLTFRSQQAPLQRAALRFLAVSAAGFAVNEAAYALLLSLGLEASYKLVLAAVLVGVASLTYLLSRHWAFLGSPTP